MLKGLPKGSSSEWKKVYNEFHADLWQFRAALIAVQSGSAEAVKFLNDLGENSPEVPILRDKNFQIKQAAAIKRGIPPIVVATQPKSGSQFLYNSLAIGLDCPFIEIQVPIYASHCLVPSWTRELRKGGQKSHLLPLEYD